MYYYNQFNKAHAHYPKSPSLSSLPEVKISFRGVMHKVE